MHKITEPEIKLVGLAARTSNRAEADPETAQIGPTLGRFFGSGLQTKIPRRKNPGRVLAVYTRYESDENGAYTYFVGEEVEAFEGVEQSLETLILPAQTYVRLTSSPGPLPNVVLALWQKIWAMSPADLRGQRAYVADFEVYDERSQDPRHAVVDVYIGVKE